MTLTRSLSFAGALFACAVFGSPRALAGDTNPPAGPVTGTMKTLDQIEPRRIINDLPGSAIADYIISEPGNYVLTGDIVSTTGYGIMIDLASSPGPQPINIDFNGFTLLGFGGSDDGIHYSGAHPVIVTVVDDAAGQPRKSGISGVGGDGIHIENARSLVVGGLRLSNIGGDGIEARGALTDKDRFIFYDLILEDGIAGDGINGEDFREYDGADVSITGTGGDGVELKTMTSGTRVRKGMQDLKISGCTGSGVKVRCANGDCIVSMTDSTITDNGGSGFEADLTGATGGTITLGGMVLDGNALHGLSIFGTGLMPPSGKETVRFRFMDRDMARGGSASGNGGDGINVSFDDTVRPQVIIAGVQCNDNAFDGIRVQGQTPVSTLYLEIAGETLCASNGGNGMTVSGSATVSNASFSGNTGHGIEFIAPGEPVKGVCYDVRNTAGSSNGGSGLKFFWSQESGPCAVKVENSMVNGNLLCGMHMDDDDGSERDVTIVDLAASGNGLDGVFVDMPTASAKKKVRKKRSSAHANGGSGFRIERCNMVEMVDCSATSNTGDGVNVVADAVRLSGCTASDNDGDGYEFSPGEPVKGVNVSVEQIAGATNGGHGLTVSDGSLLDWGSSYSGNGGDGVHADNSGFVRTVRCHNGDCSANVGGGIVVLGGSVELRDSSYTNNGSHGVLAMGNDRIVFVDNWSSANTGSGIKVLDCSSQVNINGVVATGNTDRGVHVSASAGTTTLSASVRDCSADGNGVAGVTLSDSLSGRITGCSAFSNGSIGIELLSFGNVMTGNVAGGNPGGNYVALLPGNAVGSPVDETTIGTEDNSTVNLSP